MVGSPEQTVATSPLLETKLYLPRWRPGLVPRPRLIERLDQGTEGRLTLLSAPAGFGKTTLLAEWLAAVEAGERPVAWVSLDQSDNDPTFFFAYFIAALQTVQAGVGESALSLLHSPQPPPLETLLGTLLNEIGAISHDFVPHSRCKGEMTSPRVTGLVRPCDRSSGLLIRRSGVRIPEGPPHQPRWRGFSRRYVDPQRQRGARQRSLGPRSLVAIAAAAEIGTAPEPPGRRHAGTQSVSTR